MDHQRAALTLLSVAAFAAAIVVGLVCQDPVRRVVPTLTRVATPYTLSDILGIPDEPTWTPEEVRVPVARACPTPVPAPTYDDSRIASDNRDPNCTLDNGCRHWVCHYDEDDPTGYHYAMSTDCEAAHLKQHPNDYRDNHVDSDSDYSEFCRVLPPAKEH